MFNSFSIKYLLPISVVMVGLAIAYAVVAEAQIPQPPTEEQINASGIAFPVAELGNCSSKNECRKYCEEPGNMSSCIKFAKEHGLMNDAEAIQAQKFSDRIQAGQTPGSCRGPAECERYCRDISHLDECISFAESQGLKDKHIEQGKKIRGYLKSGGRMPGGCTSKESCEVYCGDFSHAKECHEFAKSAGIMQDIRREEFSDDVEDEHFEKLMELAADGQTPGGCKSKDQCEAYCHEDGHMDECINFGVKVGFIKPDQAEKYRTLGGKGPGGCSSPEACKQYCNDQSHHEECFKFAEEHGFIPPEELKRTKEGFMRLRQGFADAPPEVAECLKSVLGSNIIEDVQSGKLVPGPEIGDRVRSCFERFGQAVNPTGSFKDAPPEVVTCLKEKLGSTFDNIKAGREMPSPEIADTFRICFEKMQFSMPQSDGFRGGRVGEPSQEALSGFLRSAPPGVAECLKQKLGDRFLKIQTGEIQPGPEMGEIMRGCFESFRPGGNNFMMPGGQPQPVGDGTPGMAKPPFVDQFSNLPPQVLECVKGSFGVDVFERVKSGAQPPTELSQKIRSCFESLYRSGGNVPAPMPMRQVCPAMPTVVSCPEGQIRAVAFSSPECGTYYTCRSATASPCPQGSYWNGKECINASTDQPPPPLSENVAVECQQGGGIWIDDKVLGSYCHRPTFEEQQQLELQRQQYQQQQYQQYQTPPTGASQYCYDIASQYYNTSDCERYRSNYPPPPQSSRSLFFSNLLQIFKTILSP
ncbi:hypothetical protein HY967_03885 [Candidatus Jorgensenbacteria bacterium]|nr:hypothetical protein [Candidatus Jorgensenbacteria bacterium]